MVIFIQKHIYYDNFLIFAQNIDRVYTLQYGKNKKNNAYPCKPPFHYIKVGCKGIYVVTRTRTCKHDGIKSLFEYAQ